ncbi:gap junction delta-4 protein-like [Aulostomus maculatus]
MAAADRLLLTISNSVSLTGKTWWVLMLTLRLMVLLLAGSTLFSDEQERFICNTIQPGCSNVCLEAFAPVSVFRLWLLHVILLCFPHVMFATYITHKMTSQSALYCERSHGGSPFSSANSSSSGEQSLNKTPLHDVPRGEWGWGVPRFHSAYLLVVILRILLEVFFGAGQFFLFGLSIPKSFQCHEAPCTSGVECYISRPTEKTLMLNFMLAVASVSVLLSLVDLASSMKAMVRWRAQMETLMEEMSKGEQSSVLTTEDTDGLLSRRASPSGGSKPGPKGENHAASGEVLPSKVSGGLTSAHEKQPDCTDTKVEMSPSPSLIGSPVPPPFVLHGHLRPPPSPRSQREPLPNAGGASPVKKWGQSTLTGANSGQHSDNNESPKDKRAWV